MNPPKFKPGDYVTDPSQKYRGLALVLKYEGIDSWGDREKDHKYSIRIMDSIDILTPVFERFGREKYMELVYETEFERILLGLK